MDVLLAFYGLYLSQTHGSQKEVLILLPPLQSMMHGKYHQLTKNLRDFVIHSIKEQHSWQVGNVEQLVMPCVQIKQRIEVYAVIEICSSYDA